MGKRSFIFINPFRFSGARMKKAQAIIDEVKTFDRDMSDCVPAELAPKLAAMLEVAIEALRGRHCDFAEVSIGGVAFEKKHYADRCARCAALEKIERLASE